MPLNITLATDSAGTEPSPAIWDRLSMTDIHHCKVKHFFENFDAFGPSTAVASNVGRYGGAHQWLSYEDTGDAVTQLATDDNGIASIVLAATDNNESWLMPGGAASVFATPRTKANNGQTILFEARVQLVTVTAGNFFVGLTEEGLAAANTIGDTGVFADKDLIGFMVLEAAPTVVDAKYNKAGAGGITTANAAIHTAVAATWVKLGFVIDMDDRADTHRIKWYVDGVTAGNPTSNAAYEAATFPIAEELHVLLGSKNNNAAKTVLCDWVRVAQLRSS